MAAAAAAAATEASAADGAAFSGQRKGSDGRIEFCYQGRRVYSWDQTLEEVNVYLEPPAGITKRDIECKIEKKRLRLGLKGNSPFLDCELADMIIPDESYWMLADGALTINLQKAHHASTWTCISREHGELDPLVAMEERKSLMRERFQAEHPGFDFSGADFSGAAPDPATFMGGMKIHR